MNAKTSVELNIPEQGINQRLDVSAAKKFFAAEQQFYNEVSSMMDRPLTIGNTNYGDTNLKSGSNVLLRKISQQLEKGMFEAVEQYAEQARDLSIVIGQGVIGGWIRQLIKQGHNEQAEFTLLVYSRAFTSQRANVVLAPFRAAAMGHPALVGAQDVLTAKKALTKAATAERNARGLKDDLVKYIDAQTEEINRLSKRYREEIIFDAPADFWGRERTAKNTEWRIYLSLFAIVASAPVALAAFFPTHVHSFISTATESNSPSGLSLGGLVAITIPALFYAWLLKNISRLFVQAHNLADDAAHRRALAMTYLGLAENKELGMSEQERALILNALFRPSPPHGADEGPPSGLLDLIKSKTP